MLLLLARFHLGCGGHVLHCTTPMRLKKRKIVLRRRSSVLCCRAELSFTRSSYTERTEGGEEANFLIEGFISINSVPPAAERKSSGTSQLRTIHAVDRKCHFGRRRSRLGDWCVMLQVPRCSVQPASGRDRSGRPRTAPGSRFTRLRTARRSGDVISRTLQYNEELECVRVRDE